jgi:hypothetical protein
LGSAPSACKAASSPAKLSPRSTAVERGGGDRDTRRAVLGLAGALLADLGPDGGRASLQARDPVRERLDSGWCGRLGRKLRQLLAELIERGCRAFGTLARFAGRGVDLIGAPHRCTDFSIEPVDFFVEGFDLLFNPGQPVAQSGIGSRRTLLPRRGFERRNAAGKVVDYVRINRHGRRAIRKRAQLLIELGKPHLDRVSAIVGPGKSPDNKERQQHESRARRNCGEQAPGPIPELRG